MLTALLSLLGRHSPRAWLSETRLESPPGSSAASPPLSRSLIAVCGVFVCVRDSFFEKFVSSRK